MIRTLVAATDASRRAMLVRAVQSDPSFVLVGEGASGHRIADMTKRLLPDVVVLDGDLDDPGCAGVARRIMAEAPTPIVLTAPCEIDDPGSGVMEALRAGALAIAPLPGPGTSAAAFLTALRTMAGVKVVRRWAGRSPASAPAAPAAHADEPRIVAMAASTGGPAALHRLMAELPADFPAPIMVVQHIAPGFTGTLVDWLSASCMLTVKVGESGEALRPGSVYVAPEGSHLGVSSRARVVLSAQGPIGGFQPSATYLFQSVARAYASAAVCIVLTGMGEDGVAGLCDVRRAGGLILVQDEKSSVVFGMPGAAVQAGLADRLLPLDAIAGALVTLFPRR